MEKTIIRIEGRKDLHKVINEIGELQAEAEKIAQKIKDRLTLAEKWAIDNPKEAFGKGTSDTTGRFDYRLTAGVRSVRRRTGFTQEQVVKLMEGCEAMAKYVFKAYDTKKIGEDFGGNADKRKSVEEVGIFFTEEGKAKLTVG